MNEVFSENTKMYDMTQPAEVMKQWIDKNNAEKLNRKYAVQTLLFSIDLHKCLNRVDHGFNTAKLVQSIDDSKVEISVGKDVLEAIETLKHRKNILQMRDLITKKEERNKARNITKLKKVITQSVQMLEDRKATLDTLLTKMQSLGAYEEDVDKYKKEICEALHILQ